MKYAMKYTESAPKPDEQVASTAVKFRLVAREAEGLFVDKNNFYLDTFLRAGLSGIIVRLYDKMQSLRSKMADPGSYPEETVEIFLDISNYAIMGALIEYFEASSESCSDHLFRAIDNGLNSEFKCLICNELLVMS
jgi:hypothetical protein